MEWKNLISHANGPVFPFPFILQLICLLPLAKALCVMYNDEKAVAADCTFLFAAG